ncbi:MAG: hypothetical protein H6Q64_419 [Firmicutes bacterium]|nr:hypothetical protein [Bacillota bacterium]
MLNAVAVVKNNFIGTGCLIPITVVLSFCATIRIVIPTEIRTCDPCDYKDFSDIQTLLMRERHSNCRDIENIIPLPVSSGSTADIISIKVYNLRPVYCNILRYPKHAVGETVFKYDLAVFYLDAKRYKTYHTKDLSALFSFKLDHIPPPEACLLSECQAEVVDLLVPN